ncbi:hypothetical protein L3Q82_013468 [Scortum barcoo]|uniref:Uncharacterized protein n=1 Tax=Scortum barcoo TaxID=214431 RepID=A0ACB8W3B5_9TELE|nr:hypothetical protein L3Q82_013468 [Scortum barcoo]
MASLTSGVHHRVRGVAATTGTRDLASHNFEPLHASTMEAENMVHSDSMSPASLGICEKLFRRSVQLPPLPADPTHHQVVIRLTTQPLSLPECPRHTAGDQMKRQQSRSSSTSGPRHRSPITEHRSGSDREAIPPDHAPPGITVVAHVPTPTLSLSPPVEQWSESPKSRALSSTPPRDSKKAGYSVLLFGRRHKQQQETYPQPEGMQGSDPLVHRSELQHMAAELGSYKQAHTSSPPLTLGNSRVVEGPAPLKELGSRAQAMRGGEPDYL